MAEVGPYIKNARLEKTRSGDIHMHIQSGDLKAVFDLSALLPDRSEVAEENIIERALEAWYADQDSGNVKAKN